MQQTLARVAPGTTLREALDRILHGRTGALIVLGHDATVESICTGGFPIDIELTATRLRELAKMDGAIVVNRDATRIVHAAVQLVPDAGIDTSESGTRHRTAERVAKQTGHPVISVSQSMHVIALYVGDRRHVIEDSATILSRANQGLQTLERYKERLDEVLGTLSALEIEDLVTVRDVAAVAQRMEMVRRISAEINGFVTELGADGRLLALQLGELVHGLAEINHLVLDDYVGAPDDPQITEHAIDAVAAIDEQDLIELGTVARTVGLSGDPEANLHPRGFRMLSRIPRLPHHIVVRLVDHFGSLQDLLAADLDDLQAVDGVGEQRARAVREGLSRMAETSILERYV